MAKIDDTTADMLKQLMRRVRALETASPIGSSSVTRGALRIASAEGLIVEGSARVSGTLNVTGTETVTGTLNVDGPLEVDGNTALRGTTTATGTVNVDGPLDIDGNVALKGDMTVSGGGKIIVSGSNTMTLGLIGAAPGVGFASGGMLGGYPGGVLMTSGGSAGVFLGPDSAQMNAGGKQIYVTATGAQVNGNLNVSNDFTVSGAKAFKMRHPGKLNVWLQHGSTESPVSGTEYTGRGQFDTEGECVVKLPDYFEALNKERNRTVGITPIGRPFPVGAEEVVAGSFVAYGAAGRSFFWLVKGERINADFPVESPMEDQGVLNSVQ